MSWVKMSCDVARVKVFGDGCVNLLVRRPHLWLTVWIDRFYYNWLVWLDRVHTAALNCVVHAWSRYKYLKWDQETHTHPFSQLSNAISWTICPLQGYYDILEHLVRQWSMNVNSTSPEAGNTWAECWSACTAPPAVRSVCRVDSNMCPHNSYVIQHVLICTTANVKERV